MAHGAESNALQPVFPRPLLNDFEKQNRVNSPSHCRRRSSRLLFELSSLSRDGRVRHSHIRRVDRRAEVERNGIAAGRIAGEFKAYHSMRGKLRLPEHRKRTGRKPLTPIT